MDSDIECLDDSNDFIEIVQKESNYKNEDPQFQLRKVEIEIKEVSRKIIDLQRKKESLLRTKERIKSEIIEKKSSQEAKKDWNRNDFNWSDDLKKYIKSVFHIENLRPFQLQTMNATLSGIDCILIMPTGGGKSLCYQLPALVSQGVTLVVSPLVSLMEDQLMALQELDINAKMMNASSTKEEVNAIQTAMIDKNSPLKLLYVTPEKLAKSKRFMTKLQKMYELGRFARLAIDEVHCCTTWGHDFRPDYKFLGIMRQMFPKTPILGLTATATTKVVTDIQKILHIEGCLVLRASFNRPNIYYEVRSKPPSQKECVEEIGNLLKTEFRNKSGIIYTMTIKDTEELATELKNRGVKIAPYHANLSAKMRSTIHRKWVDNTYQAVVATIAFGMGIDKPDVRFVIHHGISKSVENFYQESGRAGRDDGPAKSIVFWRLADLSRQSQMVFTEQTGIDNLYGMVAYCLETYRCRRNMLSEHFGETVTCDNCDHCNRPLVASETDLTKIGNEILATLQKAKSLDQRLTAVKLTDALTGKGPANLRVKNPLSRQRAETFIAYLIVDGFLKEDFHFTPYSTISYIVPGDKALAGLSPSPMQIGKLAVPGAEKRISTGTSSEPVKKPKLNI